MTRFVALALTVLAGFSGLVYEVTWEKYPATLLGSHSEATAAVLGIFLGGLSLGYSLFGKLTRRLVGKAQGTGGPSDLLVTYGALEIGIGLYAIAFFRGVPGDIALEKANRATQLFAFHYFHAAAPPENGLVDLWQRCRDSGAESNGCKQGLKKASASM